MRLAIGLFAATTLLLTACDNLKFKVVTDSEIEKQMDLLLNMARGYVKAKSERVIARWISDQRRSGRRQV